MLTRDHGRRAIAHRSSLRSGDDGSHGYRIGTQSIGSRRCALHDIAGDGRSAILANAARISVGYRRGVQNGDIQTGCGALTGKIRYHDGETIDDAVIAICVISRCAIFHIGVGDLTAVGVVARNGQRAFTIWVGDHYRCGAGIRDIHASNRHCRDTCCS